MEKKHIVKAFNEHIIDLYDDLKIIFPKNNDVRAGKTMVETFSKFNRKKMISSWHTYITNKYGEKIDAGDDDFFLQHTFEEECAGYTGSSKQENMQWMEDLKKLWKQMNSENRSKTIKYFQNLTTMSRLYYN